MSKKLDTPDKNSVAYKLDRLFQTHTKAGGKQYTHEEVAREIAAEHGPVISSTYIWELRTGRKTNPTKAHLEALSSFFKVPPGYFLESDPDIQEEMDRALEISRLLQNEGVLGIARRLSELSPEALQIIEQQIELTRKLEHLGEEQTILPRKRKRAAENEHNTEERSLDREEET